MLPEDKRKQLDEIVSKMLANNEPDSNIRFVVDDFKKKYTPVAPQVQNTGETGLKGFAVGLAKKELEIGRNLGRVGQEIAQQTAGRVIEKITGTPKEQLGSPVLDGSIPDVLKPQGTAEKVGSFAGDVALFAVPGGAVSKVTYKSPLIVRTLAEAASGGITTGLQEGDIKKAFDAAIISGIFPGAGKVASKIREATGPITYKIRENAASRIVNSLIKPGLKGFEFGKNAGRGVAKEGITANSLDDLAEKIYTKRQSIGDELFNTYSNNPRVANFSDTLKPIDDLIIKAKKAPNTNASLISRLEGVKKDILGIETAQDGSEIVTRQLDNINSADAFDIKTLVSSLTKFTDNVTDDNTVNSALMKVYGNIKGKLNKLNPGADKLNERYADLITAEVATRNRDKIAQRQNLISFTPKNILAGGAIASIFTGNPTPAVLGLGAAGIEKLLATPRAKTEASKWLIRTADKEKQKVFQANPFLKQALIRSLIETNQTK